MTVYKPLTPELRKQINISIDKSIDELRNCKSNVFVIRRKNGLNALKHIINALPDGYMIPFER